MSFWRVYNSYWFNKSNKIENQIELFKQQLYNEWYATLTEEEKDELAKQEEIDRINKETSYQKALVSLGIMTAQCSNWLK